MAWYDDSVSCRYGVFSTSSQTNSGVKPSKPRESRRTFTAEDTKTYYLPKCVHYRPESHKHSRSSLHLQLSAGLYLCNGTRCSDKGGNVDFKASHIVTKAEVLVLRYAYLLSI